MYDFMKQRKYPCFNDENALYFEPAVSRATKNPKQLKKPGEKNVLFLYGRPNVHRNLFFTALSSLDYAFKNGFLDPKEWSLFMAGDAKLPNIKLSSGPTIINKGKMPMQNYIDFSRKVDIAISPMMAPHPNYPTLELSSVGAQVVTTRYANKTDLSNYSPNIVMCDIDVESMAGAIKEAARRVASKDKSIRGARVNSTLPLTWDESLDTVLKNVIKRL